VNLFLDTRRLTQSREDHLTCFVAATLEVDSSFRRSYESLVLAPLAEAGVTPSITSVETQTHFAEQRSVPDMVLGLSDGRRVLCEHKIDAPETLQVMSDGSTVKQLERYLNIPGIAGLAYFRSSPVTVPEDVLSHALYLRPKRTAHFVWHDLFAPLNEGSSDLARWLVAGFERLGFTPPVPHVGELWPPDSDAVRDNQRNFGKLWQKTRGHLEAHWTVRQDQRGCELYVNPKSAALATQIYVSPIAQGGTLLRTRIDTDEGSLSAVLAAVERESPRLPAPPELSIEKKPTGRIYVDLLASLHLILEGADTVAVQEGRLYGQTVPIADALVISEGGSVGKRAAPAAKAPQLPPPVPQVGRLWPGTSDEVKDNQRNFGKLWQKTQLQLEKSWTIHQDQRGCELYFKPRAAAYAKKIYVSPIADGGTTLRTRIDVPGGEKEVLQQRFESLTEHLPITPRVKVYARPDRTYVDLLAPLGDILRVATTPAAQEQRLYEQIVPVVEAVAEPA